MLRKVYTTSFIYVCDKRRSTRQIGFRITTLPPSEAFIECNLRVCANQVESWIDPETLCKVGGDMPEKGPLDPHSCTAKVLESYVIYKPNPVAPG